MPGICLNNCTAEQAHAELLLTGAVVHAENPKILTQCNHHFHLACIYEWLERSPSCPVCSRTMTFEELI